MVNSNKLGNKFRLVSTALAVFLLFTFFSAFTANADDFLSQDGENYKGGATGHWYLCIENYKTLPDDFTITLWSNVSIPAYGQTLSKADLVARQGVVRIPAGIAVYMKTNHDVDSWSMSAVSVQGALLFNGSTGATASMSGGAQVVRGNIAGISGIPVGDHTLKIAINLASGSGSGSSSNSGSNSGGNSGNGSTSSSGSNSGLKSGKGHSSVDTGAVVDWFKNAINGSGTVNSGVHWWNWNHSGNSSGKIVTPNDPGNNTDPKDPSTPDNPNTPDVPGDPSTPDTPNTPTTPTDNGGGKSPLTGDARNFVLVICAALISAGILLLTLNKKTEK